MFNEHNADSQFPCDYENLEGFLKESLVESVIDGKSTSTELANQFNLKRKRINTWVYRVKKGLYLQDTVGRPRLIDEHGMRILRSYFAYYNARPEEELKAKINEEYRNSYKRKMNLDATDNLPGVNVPQKIGYRTMRRYMIMLHGPSEPLL
jgi:hypothetical protein